MVMKVDRAARSDGPSDADIIKRSLLEPDCFAEIFERHVDEIGRYAHARLGADLAEDVTAETFLAAFRRRDHYDLARGDSRPWLYGIAIRQIGKHRRAEHRCRQALARLPAEHVSADFGERLAERVDAEQFWSRLVAVLSGLPQADREVLLLVAWADLTYEEAAQALGITVSAVRSRLHRARVRTRKAFGGINPALAHEETSYG